MRTVRILIVDDAPELRTLVRALVPAGEGIEVLEADTGEEAVGMMASVPADIVIMDEQLPGMEGSTAIREIKRLVPTAEIIGFTASPEAEQAMLTAGATTHYSKLEFAAMIDHVVHRAAGIRSAS